MHTACSDQSYLCYRKEFIVHVFNLVLKRNSLIRKAYFCRKLL